MVVKIYDGMSLYQASCYGCKRTDDTEGAMNRVVVPISDVIGLYQASCYGSK